MGEQRGSAAASGLEGIVVADTRMSSVDGGRGVLIVGGFEVEALAERVGFEGACGLLWGGELPDAIELGGLRRRLGEARVEAFEALPMEALGLPDAMAALRAVIGRDSMGAAERGDEGAILIVGMIGVAAAAWSRLSRGLRPVAPDPERGHGEDFLRMIQGERPSAASVRGIDAYLTTVIDHGMNASTFTARVVASTGSDLVSAVTAAIGALKGPLHGGAPGPVLDMLDAIGAPEGAGAWLEGELAAGRRIMGMGHRVYRVRDPRAAVLERAIGRLEGESGRHQGRLALARAVEAEAERLLAARHPGRPLRANVEFYTAVLLEALGIPRALFSATFCASRAAGWCAHVEEQRAVGRLIRPSSRYVGPAPVA